MQAKFIILLLIFFLSSCSQQKTSFKSIDKDPIKNTLANSEKFLSNKYQLKDTNVIFLYNLGANQCETKLTNSLYAYALVNKNTNKQVLNNYSIFKQNIRTNSVNKLAQIHQLITTLKLRYKLPLLTSKTDPFKQLVKMHRNFGRFLPIINPSHLAQVTSNYGTRKHPQTGKIKMHTGIDLASNKRMIFAAAEGMVYHLGLHNNGYGKHIIIDHLNGFKTLYAHLENFMVRKGQKVLQGELIGIEGKSGSATGVHLHFETIYQNQKINPSIFFK